MKPLFNPGIGKRINEKIFTVAIMAAVIFVIYEVSKNNQKVKDAVSTGVSALSGVLGA